MITPLARIFGSYMKAQEIVLLLKGVKPLVRHGFYEEELPKIIRFCEQYNLHVVQSKFKVLLADETSYSNKGIRIQENDRRPGMYFVYISQDEQTAWLASYFELMGNETDLGKLLGYPTCCVDYFVKQFNGQNPNPELTPTNRWTNLSKREDDRVLLSHFPCHSDCQESVTLAQKYLQVLTEYDREYGTQLYSTLTLE